MRVHPQTNPNSPDFSHNFTKESPWVSSGRCSPFCIPRTPGLQQVDMSSHKEERESEGEFVEEGFPSAGKTEKRLRAAEGICEVHVQEEGKLNSAFLLHNSSQRKMQQNVSQSRMLVASLKTCTKQKDLQAGSRIHADIVRKGLLENNIFLGSALINMYSKCGSVAKAQDVFNKLPVRNLVSWNALIAGYAQHGHGQQAVKCFEQMQLEGLSPDAVTYVCILKACGSIKDAVMGEEIHSKAAKEGLLGTDVVVGTALIDMYAKCDRLAKAVEVFEDLPIWNVVSWNALIAGFVQHGHGEQALEYFDRMQLKGFFPDAVTFISILKACGSLGAADKGKEIHAKIMKEGLLKKDVVVGNALVDMYVKCGLLAKAQEVFDKLPLHNVVTWNALMAGYAQRGLGEQVLLCFKKMQEKGLYPDSVTFICLLKACGSMQAADKGIEVHVEIVRQGWLKKDIVLGNALVDMYVKCGLLPRAEEVFDKLPFRDVVSWNGLMAGYVQHGLGEQTLKCFNRMKNEGPSPDAITYTCILKACGSMGAAEKGKEIHTEIVREGFLKKNQIVGTALVDMYAKCGLLAQAQEVFDELPLQDVVARNVLMAGYALVGKAEHVFSLFDDMIEVGVKPDLFAFTIVLNACRHTGQLEKGQVYFETMRTHCGLIPTLQHYSCMVDLFARAGHLNEAAAVIKGMPYPADRAMWLIVLSACKKWGNKKLGRLAFEHAVQLDEKDASPYVSMGDIFAAAARPEDADMIAAMSMGTKEALLKTDASGVL